jgi:hypothetical protein
MKSEHVNELTKNSADHQTTLDKMAAQHEAEMKGLV